MRTLATKQPAKDANKQRYRERASSPASGVRLHNISPVATGMPLIQRKCACGGGCPRCQAVSDSDRPRSVDPLNALSDLGLIHTNAAEDTEETVLLEEPFSSEPSSEISQPFLASSFDESPSPIEAGETPEVEPLDTQKPAQSACPTKTVVEKTIDMTPEGIKKGYRTGYGATAVMRVEPTGTNWDGTPIVESLKQTKNTCPEDFKISPCSGNSTFTVGAESQSSVLGTLEAKQNHFYDFHISRWNKGSLLHDRNPDNVDSCQVECSQEYSCGKAVIGKHTVTRTFTKGKSGTRDVTLVAVSKK